jgi:hypothetical protein
MTGCNRRQSTAGILEAASETHSDTNRWSNEPRTEKQGDEPIRVRICSVSVDPVQPNLWNNLYPATDLNPEIRTDRQTNGPDCQLNLGSKRSEVSGVHTCYWNRCALQVVFLNNARTNDKSQADRAIRRGVNVKQSREHEVTVFVVCLVNLVVIRLLHRIEARRQAELKRQTERPLVHPRRQKYTELTCHAGSRPTNARARRRIAAASDPLRGPLRGHHAANARIQPVVLSVGWLDTHSN